MRHSLYQLKFIGVFVLCIGFYSFSATSKPISPVCSDSFSAPEKTLLQSSSADESLPLKKQIEKKQTNAPQDLASIRSVLLSPASFEEIELYTEIAASGLVSEFPFLANRGALLTIYDFLEIKIEPPYILGLSDGNDIYSAVDIITKGYIWPEAYRRHGVNPKEVGHTNKFMKIIYETEQPIVFLVPRNLMMIPSITQNEMEWILESAPRKNKKVYFVFGAYDFIKKEKLDELNRMGNALLLVDFIKANQLSELGTQP